MQQVRETQSVCPECLKPVPARVVEDAGAAWLRKSCPEHGESQCLLSGHPWYYLGLDRYYFSVMPRAHPQRDYMVRMTERCNLQCPICLAAAGSSDTKDYDLDVLWRFLDNEKGRVKIDLLSAEPTLREDLFDVIREIKRRGHIVALHTNGIKLASPSYVRELKEAGLDEVHLQLDGFDDDAYMRIRGARLTRLKQRVLENLEAADLATDLVMVIMPDTNEDEIPKVLEYARQHTFVRELFFLGTRALGFFKDSKDLLMPDQVIGLVDERTDGLCAREDVFRFQKLYFGLLSVLGVRKCLYVQHYLLMRDGDGWLPARDLLHWRAVEAVLDDLPAAKGWRRPLWGLRLAWALASSPRLWHYLPDFLGMALHLKLGWNLGGLPRRVLLLGYITACDPLNVDFAVTENCGKGELSMDVGCHASSAIANIERERRWAGK